MSDRDRQYWYPIFIIMLVAIFVSLPPFFLGFPTYSAESGHDAGPALQWLDRFARQFWQGDLYPRWLVEGDHGLGQPAFYFYSPLGYWFGALLRGPGEGWIRVDQAMALTLLLCRMFSGGWCFILMRRHMTTVASLFGATFYITCIYTLDIDIYVRTAFAETVALSFFPLVLIGIEDTVAGRSRGVVILTASIAFATLSHVLSCVLLVIPCGVYSLVLGWDKKLKLILVGLSALAGIAIAGFYVVPALNLQGLVRMEAMFGGAKDPANWFLDSEYFRNTRPHLLLLILAQIIMTFAFWVVLKLTSPSFRLSRGDWACLAALLVGVVMLTGLSTPLWRPGLPFFRVQFPWRLMGVISLLGALMMANAYARSVFRFRFAGAILFLLIGLCPTAWSVIDYKFVKMPDRLSLSDGNGNDVKEYIPRSWGGSYPIVLSPDAKPQFKVEPAGTGMATPGSWRGATIIVATSAPQGGTLIVPQHFFPMWQARVEGEDTLTTVSFGPLGLLGVQVPPGDWNIIISRGHFVEEWVGVAVSLLGFMMSAALTVWARRGRR